MTLVIEETGWFYVAHVAVSMQDDQGHSVPVMSKNVTHAKTEEDGFDGLLSAVRAIL